LVGGVYPRRIGVTVGTVATNSVPFDLGAGDNLPSATTPVTVMVQNVEPFVLTGDDVTALIFTCETYGSVSLLDASDAVLATFALNPTGTDGGNSNFGSVYIWTTDDGTTNPIAGDDVAKVTFTHGLSTGTGNKALTATGLYN
jgi:hypothetical protein